MILRYFYTLIKNRDGSERLWRSEEVRGALNSEEAAFAKYIGGVFHFDINSISHCQAVLEDIRRLKQGEVEKAGWTGNAFITDLYRDHVQIEHQQFRGEAEWPTWTCSLEEFETSLVGWKRFLEMPWSLESEVSVELRRGGNGWRQCEAGKI